MTVLGQDVNLSGMTCPQVFGPRPALTWDVHIKELQAMAEAIMAANDKQGMVLYYREAELKVNSTHSNRFISIY